MRGHSSAGRASALQAEGRRFDPDWLHQETGPKRIYRYKEFIDIRKRRKTRKRLKEEKRSYKRLWRL
ncbi:MAG: hypothetical protein RLY40_373 [Pseudomonadota bacterium]